MTTLPLRIGSPRSARRRRRVGSRLTIELVPPPIRNPLSRFHHHPGCRSSLFRGTQSGKRQVRTIIPNPVRRRTDVSAPMGVSKSGRGDVVVRVTRRARGTVGGLEWIQLTGDLVCTPLVYIVTPYPVPAVWLYPLGCCEPTARTAHAVSSFSTGNDRPFTKRQTCRCAA